MTEAGLARATVVTMGFGNVVRAYMPQATLVAEGMPLPDRVDVVLLDPDWASRFEAPSTAALLRAVLPEMAECRFDQLHV